MEKINRFQWPVTAQNLQSMKIPLTFELSQYQKILLPEASSSLTAAIAATQNHSVASVAPQTRQSCVEVGLQ